MLTNVLYSIKSQRFGELILALFSRETHSVVFIRVSSSFSPRDRDELCYLGPTEQAPPEDADEIQNPKHCAKTTGR